MKFLSESKALELLDEIRGSFREVMDEHFGFRAMDCETCDVQGICCTDEHFVNVRITRLEAAAIRRVIHKLDAELREVVRERIELAAKKKSAGKEFFACPLYEKGIGCLVHKDAKPMPCIFHACYERKDQIPPDEMLDAAEAAAAFLNARTYGAVRMPLPIPVALAGMLAINSNAEAVRQAPSSDTASERK
jgi:hypothetical protein